MRDTQLYQRIPDLEEPWKVKAWLRRVTAATFTNLQIAIADAPCGRPDRASPLLPVVRIRPSKLGELL